MNYIRMPSLSEAGHFQNSRLSSGWSRARTQVHVLNPDPALCECIAIKLKLEGLAVDVSTRWTDFLYALEAGAPRLLVAPLLLDGTDTLRLVRHSLPRGTFVPVILVAEAPTTEQVVAAMKGGASDFLSLPVDIGRLAAAAREAMPKSTVPVPEGWPASPNLQVLGISSLTNRQRQILELLMDGRSSKEIGAILGNSTRTIEGHRSRILQKMNARNNSDLMRKILSH